MNIVFNGLYTPEIDSYEFLGLNLDTKQAEGPFASNKFNGIEEKDMKELLEWINSSIKILSEDNKKQLREEDRETA
jgi:hypothetical protein